MRQRWGRKAVPRRKQPRLISVTRTLCARVPPALQLPAVFLSTVGCEIRRTNADGIDLVSKVVSLFENAGVRSGSCADPCWCSPGAGGSTGLSATTAYGFG